MFSHSAVRKLFRFLLAAIIVSGTITGSMVFGTSEVSAASTTFANVSANTAAPAVYGKYELTFDLSTTYDNPFNPDEADVRAYFLTPGGQTEVVPAFYRSDSSPKWAVRYSPRLQGSYSAYLKVTDANGTGQSSASAFTAGPAAAGSRGFMAAAGSRFTDSLGKQITLLGTNYAWSSPNEILSAMPQYKAAQMNVMRVWLNCWWANYAPEYGPVTTYQNGIGMTYQGIGRYQLENSARMDTLMETARDNGLYIMLTLNSFGDFFYDWAYHAYNTANGGPSSWSDNNTDFWTNPTAIAYQKKLLRYIFARWGYSTSLGMLEYWNEADNHVNDYANKPYWHEAVDTYWKSLDFYHHPTTTSFAWMDQLGFNQTSWGPLTTLNAVNHHFYIDSKNGMDIWESNIKYSLANYGNRPTFIGEVGYTGPGAGTLGAPLTKRFVHDGIWGPVFRAGAAGANLLWVEDQDPVLSGFNLPPVYKEFYNAFAGFIKPEEYYLPSMPHVDYGLQSNDAKVGAFKNADRALLWVNDTQATYDVGTPRTVSGMSFTLPSMNNGTYDIRFVDTVSGATMSTATAAASGGNLVLAIPSFARDIAVKVVRQGSAAADAQAPTQPANVVVTGKTDATVSLGWDPSFDNLGVAGYVISRNGTVAATNNGKTGFTDSGLAANTSYTYTIAAKDAAGNTSSAVSYVVSTNPLDAVAPTAPANVIVSGKSDTAVSLSWEASTDNVSVTGYDIYRGAALIGSTTSALSYTDTGLTPSTAYAYSVKAKDARNNVSAAGTAVVTTFAPNANFLANPGFEIDDGTGRLANWPCEQFYYCTRDTSVARSGASSMKVDGNTNAWFGTGQDIPAVPGQAYALDGYVNIGRNAATTVRVMLKFLNADKNAIGEQTFAALTGTTNGWVNVNGKTTAPAGTAFARAYIHFATLDMTLHLDDFSLAKAAADTQAPSTPAGVASTGKTASTIDLSWNESTDNYGVTGYDVYRNGALVGSSGWNAFTDTGLAAGTAYTYTVKAKDAAGNASPASTAVTVTTTGTGGGDSAAPTAPGSLTSPAKTSTSVSLAWTASTDNVGVTAYDIYNGDSLAGSTTGQTNYTVTGLTPGTAYGFTVKARDASGNVSPASGSLSVTTEPNAAGTWTFCATEGGACSFTGTKTVRYGANGTYATGTFTGGVSCTNAVFGDPVVGVEKHCDISEPAPAVNLLLNPGFETDNGSGKPTEWTSDKAWFIARDTVVKRSGDASLKIETDSGAWLGTQQTVTGTAGLQYVLNGYVNIPAITGSHINFLVEFLDGGGQVLSSNTAGSFNAATPSGWTNVHGSYAAPANTASVRVVIQTLDVNGTIYVDDLVLSNG
ncbi:fibronectin type III domain-containing protein [Paenibacillus sacheonensis]|uniref:DUF5060 domain-containing protein n=1 Tax=Paenibacillus sacheonensis TaxID=742054 RepID=A0A7X5BZM9_9BACL|nr:fibronectin type III domain-containing protein [Paenibacillus sacheonensis]MBM7567262.1 chitodextrinase [Paenibacillus sacheonensis]NBC72843.1 DUF5060 domain-containing protein [Paenibacillus sacheonensis]